MTTASKKVVGDHRAREARETLRKIFTTVRKSEFCKKTGLASSSIHRIMVNNKGIAESSYERIMNFWGHYNSAGTKVNISAEFLREKADFTDDEKAIFDLGYKQGRYDEKRKREAEEQINALTAEVAALDRQTYFKR